jgi:manganese transport protein
MLAGMAINSAMVIVAAAVFHKNGVHVTDLTQASETLRPLAGNLASVIFGMALLFAGISSSMTAGMAGGTTFSGYLGKETRIESKWFRIGLVITLLPALAIIMMIKDTFHALIFSQVCLSVQLPLTMLPLFLLIRSRNVMGRFANGWLETLLMSVTGMVIVGLNVLLVVRLFGGSF